MHLLQSLIASVVLLLPAVGAVAEPAAPTDFAMEMILSQPPPPGRAVVVRCLEGCDWTERAIQCPVEQGDCRALIAGRRLDTAQTVHARRPKARPIAESQCLGLHVITNPPGEMIQRCEHTEEEGNSSESCYAEEVPAADSRAFVNDVLPESPAELAGFSPGDVIVSVNGAPIVGRMDVINAIRSMKAGQLFDALLERDGAPMTIQGRVGIAMSDGVCAVADARLLETAVKYDPNADFGPFKLVFDLPGGNVEFQCLEGCAGGMSGYLCGMSFDGPIDRCIVRVYQDVGGELSFGGDELKDAFPEPSERK